MIISNGLYEKIHDVTPVQFNQEQCTKYDDEFVYNGVVGTRGRMVVAIVDNLVNDACFVGIGFACGRNDVDALLLSCYCKEIGVKCTLFMPTGAYTDVMTKAQETFGATIIQVANGYSNVLQSRAQNYCYENDLGYVPLKLMCQRAMQTVMPQCREIPSHIKRIVVYDDSVVIVSGIMSGLQYYGRNDVQVVGITNEREPYGNITKLLGSATNYLDRPQVSFIYYREKPVKTSDSGNTYLGHVINAHDALCIRHLKDGDMFWICGNHAVS